jgi:hypothetical protein
MRGKTMLQKEIEKQNFILWYSLYATEKELEMARTNNGKILERLLREYAEEIDKIDKSWFLYEKIIHLRSVQTQGFDATLKIDYFPQQSITEVLEKV